MKFYNYLNLIFLLLFFIATIAVWAPWIKYLYSIVSQCMVLAHSRCSIWRRKWQPTPVFLPGESQGRGSLVGDPAIYGVTQSRTRLKWLSSSSSRCSISISWTTTTKINKYQREFVYWMSCSRWFLLEVSHAMGVRRLLDWGELKVCVACICGDRLLQTSGGWLRAVIWKGHFSSNNRSGRERCVST